MGFCSFRRSLFRLLLGRTADYFDLFGAGVCVSLCFSLVLCGLVISSLGRLGSLVRLDLVLRRGSGFFDNPGMLFPGGLVLGVLGVMGVMAFGILLCSLLFPAGLVLGTAFLGLRFLVVACLAAHDNGLAAVFLLFGLLGAYFGCFFLCYGGIWPACADSGFLGSVQQI